MFEGFPSLVLDRTSDNIEVDGLVTDRVSSVSYLRTTYFTYLIHR